MKQLLTLIGALAVLLTAVAPSHRPLRAADGTEPARVRVAHASPDAPAVDILVNGTVAFSNAPFGAITDYAELPSGTYNIKVVPTGAKEPVVIEADLNLEAGADYTVAATGLLANIAAAVFVDNNTLPEAGKAHVRFVHLSPDAPAVNIAVKDGPKLFNGIAFPTASDYLPVDAGTYVLTVSPTEMPALVLEYPNVKLELGGVYTVFAMGRLSDSSLAPIIKLDAKAPQPSGTARVRVTHGSPDAPAVDVLVNGAVAFSNATFGATTGYATLPEGSYNVKVVPTGATTPVVIEANLVLEAGKDYTVAAVGRLAEIMPLVLMDDNRQPAAGKAHVRFVHAAPDAPAVDIAVAGGPVLFSNISFKEVGAYLPVEAASYDLEVRLAGTQTVALALPGVKLEAGTVYSIFGLQKANSSLLWASMVVDAEYEDMPPKPTGKARVRVAHASPDAPAVDILVNGTVAFSNAPFGAITNYAELPSGTYNIKVVPTGAKEPVVIEADLNLEAGADYTVAATGLLANIAAAVFVDDNRRPAAGKAHVRFVHASPDAPAVDIAVAGGGPVLFSNISFGKIGAYLPVDAGTYDLEVRLAGTMTVALAVPDLVLDAGTVYTVFAMGLAAGDPALRAVPTVDAEYPEVKPPMPKGGMIYLPSLLRSR